MQNAITTMACPIIAMLLSGCAEKKAPEDKTGPKAETPTEQAPSAESTTESTENRTKDEALKEESPSETEAPIPIQRRTLVFKMWDVTVTYDEQMAQRGEGEGEDDNAEEDTTEKEAEEEEGKFGDPDEDPVLSPSKVPKREASGRKKIDPAKVGLVDLLASSKTSLSSTLKPDGLKERVGAAMNEAGTEVSWLNGPGDGIALPKSSLPLTARHFRAAQQQARWDRIDAIASNRYGSMTLSYEPGRAAMQLTQIKYKESIEDFIARRWRAGPDKRVKVEERELKKVRMVTTGLKKSQLVSELQFDKLPLTSRSNPKDRADAKRVKACTDSPDDYCTFEYRARFSHEGYREQSYLLTNPFSQHPPGASPEVSRTLSFRRATRGVWVLNWHRLRLSKASPTGGTR